MSVDQLLQRRYVVPVGARGVLGLDLFELLRRAASRFVHFAQSLFSPVTKVIESKKSVRIVQSGAPNPEFGLENLVCVGQCDPHCCAPRGLDLLKLVVEGDLLGRVEPCVDRMSKALRLDHDRLPPSQSMRNAKNGLPRVALLSTGGGGVRRFIGNS